MNYLLYLKSYYSIIVYHSILVKIPCLIIVCLLSKQINFHWNINFRLMVIRKFPSATKSTWVINGLHISLLELSTWKNKPEIDNLNSMELLLFYTCDQPMTKLLRAELFWPFLSFILCALLREESAYVFIFLENYYFVFRHWIFSSLFKYGYKAIIEILFLLVSRLFLVG